LLVVATATPAARQTVSLAQLKSYCKANGFALRHALQQEQSPRSRRAAVRSCSRARLLLMIAQKNPACPTFKLWQSRVRNGDNEAQVPI
jgi:hypothetical protein